MPRTSMTTHKGHQVVGGDPQRSQARPDAGARKAAKKLRDLEVVAKQFALTVLGPGRIAAMSTGELIDALDALVRAERFYLSRSRDARPIREGQSFTIMYRKRPPGVDPLAHLYSNNHSVPQPPPEDEPPPAASGGMEEERAIRAPR